MTGPSRPAPPPGWYPDPDGAPGIVRWWSGTAWSDVTTPAGPGVAVQRSPVLAPPRAPELFSSDPEARPPSRPRSPWLVPLLVLALVVVAARAMVAIAIITAAGVVSNQ